MYKEIKERGPELVYSAVRSENTYLLESCEGGEKIARYSFIGFNPAAKLTVDNGKINFNLFDPDLKDLEVKGENPIEILRNLMSQFNITGKTLSRFFGGFVGYFSYDLVRYFVDLNSNTRNDLKEPDCEFILAKNNIIFDHKKKKTYLISHQFLPTNGEIDESSILEELEEISESISSFPHYEKREEMENSNNFSSNICKREFKENVERAKEYIYAGDIFQVVLSQRFGVDFDGDKFQVYSTLKRINPSPYMYYLDFGERKIIGSSPEMLVRVENRRVETYPIAGTRPRGKTPEEDKKLEREMLRDEKELAEHLMLVDLGRNDIGRVARFGTVKVKRFMQVEKYSHVQHMVSEVVGELKPGMDEFDALQSIFPAGTVSGAPKVRAMEIIEELEPTRRGIYSGAVGYFSFNRNMDTAITIRTVVFEKDRAYIQAGAGIVADSIPEREFQETMNKARGMLKALGVDSDHYNNKFVTNKRK
ncbi:MAG: anthranilate synthase component I [Candidatus Altiarchaeales archaeon]|nr:MAG: anthranilate synthase component I [Candidatus Altiarchaeales archaeon]